jgi:hypothetical protein
VRIAVDVGALRRFDELTASVWVTGRGGTRLGNERLVEMAIELAAAVEKRNSEPRR